jgi:hypothetical protein
MLSSASSLLLEESAESSSIDDTLLSLSSEPLFWAGEPEPTLARPTAFFLVLIE